MDPMVWKHYLAFLADKEAACAKERGALFASGREDESDLKKVEENIYGICRTSLEALRRARPDGFADAYRAQLAKLEAAWTLARETASAHGSEERAIIEGIKLAALETARAACPAGEEAVHA